jgi:hypothetical protein
LLTKSFEALKAIEIKIFAKAGGENYLVQLQI